MPIIVNGEQIEDHAVEAEYMRLQRGGPEVAPELEGVESAEQLREHAKENLIIQVLLRQEAEKQVGELPEEEVEAGLSKLMEEHGGKEAFYQRFGLSEDDDEQVRKHVIDQLRVPKLFDILCKDVPEPTPAEVRKFYDDNPQSFMLPPQVHVAHIVKRPDPEGAAYKELLDVRRRLKKGADFAKLADKHSECSNEPGGDLGFFPKGQMVEEFETVVFSLDLGEISPIFQTQFGYHIATVLDKKDSMRQPFDEAKAELKEGLFNDRKNDEIGKYVEALKEAATIVEIEPAEPEKEADEDDPAAE